MSYNVKEFNRMQSFIIASKNNEEALEKAKSICLEKKISQFDLTIESFEKTVGIEEVRNFTKKLFLKPFQGDSKALVINAPLGITIESQNALLKILEEPPVNTFIFLVVENTNILLPTILSRCKTIKLEKEAKAIDEKEVADFKKILDILVSENAGYKLKLAQDYGKSREEAINFLESSILALRQIMLSDARSDLVNFVKIIQMLEEGRTAVKTTNVNQRFILENTLLSISH